MKKLIYIGYILLTSSPPHILLHQRADQYRQDVLLDHGLRQVLAVLGQAAQGQSRCLLDAGNHVQHQRSQQGNHAFKGKKERQPAVGKARSRSSLRAYPRMGSYLHSAGSLCCAGSMRVLQPIAQTASVTSDTARKPCSTGGKAERRRVKLVSIYEIVH